MIFVVLQQTGDGYDVGIHGPFLRVRDAQEFAALRTRSTFNRFSWIPCVWHGWLPGACIEILATEVLV